MSVISVIIPVYNKQNLINDTIKSVLNQTFTDFELIIINDGSTDNSDLVIKSFSDTRIHYFEQENKGVSFARNKGVSLAKTNLIAFLDGDDIWEPNHLQTILKLSKKYPSAHFFGTAYKIKYPGGLTRKFVADFFIEEDILIKKFYRYTQASLLFYTSNFAIKKEIFEKENGFKSNLHGEDTEFFLRLGFSYNLAYSKQITMTHLNNSENSLFANYKTDKKVIILTELKELEKKDYFLKKILDQSRFAWIMEYKISNEKAKENKLRQQINIKNLNYKQRILLHFSGKILKNLKNIQKFLIKRKIYLSPFK